jgi:hypothetical protein
MAPPSSKRHHLTTHLTTETKLDETFLITTKVLKGCLGGPNLGLIELPANLARFDPAIFFIVG